VEISAGTIFFAQKKYYSQRKIRLLSFFFSQNPRPEIRERVNGLRARMNFIHDEEINDYDKESYHGRGIPRRINNVSQRSERSLHLQLG